MSSDTPAGIPSASPAALIVEGDSLAKRFLNLKGWEALQIIATSQALKMAAKHKIFPYARPRNVRKSAVYFLNLAGVKINGREKWQKLSADFDAAFHAVINHE